MHPIADTVNIDLDADELRRLIDALDHYAAYLHSQQREGEEYRHLLLKLRKSLATKG
jgi:hypothetical protein